MIRRETDPATEGCDSLKRVRRNGDGKLNGPPQCDDHHPSLKLASVTTGDSPAGFRIGVKYIQARFEKYAGKVVYNRTNLIFLTSLEVFSHS